MAFDAKLMEKWLAWLEEKKFRQAFGTLRSESYREEDEDARCCLGVVVDACDASLWHFHPRKRVWAVPNKSKTVEGLLPRHVAARLGLHRLVGKDEEEAVQALCKRLTGHYKPNLYRLPRQKFLAHLNDDHVSHPDIASAVRELGWDRE